jgi:hypothetical protein
MQVEMMHVRNVRMRVSQTDVLVKMSVSLPRRIRSAVGVLVMLVVQVWVCVRDRFMNMLMFMTLGQV